MPDAACRVKWLGGRCAPSRVIWDAERLLVTYVNLGRLPTVEQDLWD
jgi:hypothetical protein